MKTHYQPYFARVDYFITDDSTQTINDEAKSTTHTTYLGVTRIREPMGVASWTSPIAELYYTSGRQATYTTKEGLTSAQIDLKRYLRIRDQQLHTFHDILPRMLTAPDGATNQLLKDALNQTSPQDGQLQNILSTIEPGQYKSISSHTERVMIIQGAAGSGKSAIGFHRIAYLLSPFTNLPQQQQPTPRTTLFLGPSTAFLEYASDVLPQLGIRERIQQTKFTDWLSQQMTHRPRLNFKIWRNLLRPGTKLEFNAEAELFKGSLVMADVIDRYVTTLINDIRQGASNSSLSLTIQNTEVIIPETEIRTVLSDVLPARQSIDAVNRRRESFINQILDRAFAKLPRRPNITRSEARTNRSKIRNQAIVPWCNQFWEHIDFEGEYAAMLLDSNNLVALSQNKISEAEAQTLEDAAAVAEKSGFDDSDLGAMAYMDHKLNGTITRTFRHIVVDEAQDISPIEFKLLSMASVNNYFTILGDTAQRLALHKGIRSWRELNPVFSRANIEVQHALTSYRASSQITRFNNKLLRTFDTSVQSPKPFGRQRFRVEYHPCANVPDMHTRVVQQLPRIRSLEAMEDATIAILVRDNNQFNQFQDSWAKLGLGEIATLSTLHWNSSRTILGHIYDAKGLEFDAVIIIGVGQSFHDTLFDKKLLYLGTTRAKQHLSIFWTGKRSPILDGINSRGVRLITQ